MAGIPWKSEKKAMNAVEETHTPEVTRITEAQSFCFFRRMIEIIMKIRLRIVQVISSIEEIL
jgi:hypothetical protein